jgi:NitT/TauT family transport system substrate-binding protein
MTHIDRRAFVAGAAAVTASVFTQASALAQNLVPVRVGASLDDGITPVLYGIHAGLYQQAGLDVQMQPAENGAALATAIAGGAIDIAKSSAMALISAHAHGVFFKMVAGGAEYDDNAPTTESCVLNDSPIKNLADFAGKTIAVNSLQSLEVLATDAAIDQSGGNPATVKYVEIPDVAMLGALEQGRADIAAITNPALAAALNSGKVRVVAPTYRGLGKRLLIASWFCTELYAKNNPDVCKKFAAATRTATLYTNAHHAETVPILAAYSHLDPAVIGRMTRLTSATSLNASEIQPAIDAAAKYKFIPSAFPASAFFIAGA